MQNKPRSFLLQPQGVPSQSRGASHLEEFTPLNAFQDAFGNMISFLSILQHNEAMLSNWTPSSYSESLRRVTSLVERRPTSSSDLTSSFSHGRQAWSENSKWWRMKIPHNLWKVLVWYQSLMPLWWWGTVFTEHCRSGLYFWRLVLAMYCDFVIWICI